MIAVCRWECSTEMQKVEKYIKNSSFSLEMYYTNMQKFSDLSFSLQCYINNFLNKIIPLIFDTDKQVSHLMAALLTKCRERLMRVLLIKGIERNKIFPSLSLLSPLHIKTKIMTTNWEQGKTCSLPGTMFSLGSYSWHIALKTQGKTWYCSRSLWIPDGCQSYTEGKVRVHRSETH